MTVRKPRERRSPRKLPAACEEHERVIEALRREVIALEHDRDAVRQGFEKLTRALRHRGCCDSIDRSRAHT